MMECRQIRIVIHEALSRTLAGEEQAVLDGHLRGCRACRAEYAMLHAVVRAVEEAPPLQPSVDFTLKVMDRLPTPILIFGRVPARVFWGIVGSVGFLAGIVTWVYRASVLRTFQEMPDLAAGRHSISSAFQIARSAVRTSLETLLHLFPAPLEPHRLQPVLSVLIAIGIAVVVLKMIDGFQATEFDSIPDESYS